MAKKLFSLHGAGGNAGGGGYGSGASHPSTSGVTTFPGNSPSNWSSGTSEAINWIRGNVVAGDQIIICGFSAGAGMALQILQSGETFGGTLRGVIADDPAWPGSSNFAGRAAGVLAALYATDYNAGVHDWVVETLQGGPPAGGLQAMANALGISIQEDPNYHFHHPMMDAVACYAEALSGSSWWTGGSTTPPPPANSWPLYQAEGVGVTLLNPQTAGIVTRFVTTDGALGTGYVGSWYQSPEAIRIPVTPPAAGAYNAKIRFRQAAAGGSVRKIRIAGVDRGNVPFPNNASAWSDSIWTELTVENLPLAAGVQNFDLEYVSGSGPDVDQVTFEVYTAPGTGGGGGGTGGTPTSLFDVKTNRAGFESTGYVGGWDAVGENIKWNAVAIPTAGPYRLGFRYASKTVAAAIRSLYIDNVKVQNLTFAKTAASDVDALWGEVVVDIASMTAGNHVVELRIDTGQGGVNIEMDRLQVRRVPAPGNPGGGTGGGGTPPPTTGAETVVQAEAGTLSNVTGVAKHGSGFADPGNPGYNATGYVGSWAVATETLTLTLTAPSTGSYSLRFRYRNGNTSVSSLRNFTVNGVAQPQLVFPKTAPLWTDSVWGNLLRAGVPLNSGANTIVLVCPSGASMGLDLDEIGFTLETGTGGGGTTTPVSVTVQAETATLGNADPSSVQSIQTYLAGYAGSGFVANDWHPGDTQTMTVTIPAGMTGDYDLTVRYVNPETFAYSRGLTVNGVSAGSVGPFPPTAGGYSGAWQTLVHPTKVHLVAGANTLIFTTSSEYGEWLFDQINVAASITTGGGGGGPPPVTLVGTATIINGLQLFPADNMFYAKVDALATRTADSTARINGTMARNEKFSGYGYHNQVTCDFRSDGSQGLPFTVVPASQPKVAITYPNPGVDSFPAESDQVPAPFVQNQPLETGSDSHAIALSADGFLYEAWAAHPNGTGFNVGTLARWPLNSNSMRQTGWTSADAAGMPILPGCYLYDEVARGFILHAGRICVDFCSAEYEWPANHIADYSEGVSGTLMKMGTWLRLKASTSLAGLGPQATIIATALKRHGAIVADIGPNWKLSGAPDSRWNNADLDTIGALVGTDFEIVNTSSIKVSNTSMQTTQGVQTYP